MSTAQERTDRMLGLVPKNPADDYAAEERAGIQERPAPLHGVKLLGVDEIFATQPDAQFLIPALGIAPGAPTGLFGQGYVGKTLIATSIALAVASGSLVWGLYMARRGRVLHLDYEQGLRVTARRTQRLARGMGIAPESLRNRMSWGILPNLRLTSKDAEDHFAELFTGYALVILDALKGLTPGVEENSSEIRDYMNILTRAAERTGCVVLLLHHAGKTPPTGSKPRKEMGRGSSGIFDECQTVFVATGEKGQPIYVSHEKDRELGATVQDFGLRIEDVNLEGDPKAGLRVVHLDASQTKQGPDLDAEMDRVIGLVRKCIEKCPGIAGAELIQPRVGVRMATVRAAVRSLLVSGEVVNVDRRYVRLFLKHMVPQEAN